MTDINIEQLYELAVTIIALGTGVIAIPSAWVNAVQKVLTALDNKLAALEEKDDTHKQMIDDGRAFIDEIYTDIADGKLTLLEIGAAAKKAKKIVEDLLDYKVPVPGVAAAADPTVLEILKGLQTDVAALKAAQAPVVPATATANK